jgi:hypothetical protein
VQRNWLVLILVLYMGPAIGAPTQSQVDSLSRKCEAQREKAMAPIRADRVKDCKEQQLKSPGHCERYYQTYGNASHARGVSARGGMYYDLPVCQDWLRERDALTASRSRTSGY